MEVAPGLVKFSPQGNDLYDFCQSLQDGTTAQLLKLLVL